MRRVANAAFAAVFMLAASAGAQAGVVVTVDKSAQQLTVEVDGATRYQWPVSTARWGFRTPVGSYRPQRLERQWYSRKYDWSPMPYSIFFDGGYAIHGSNEISRLGRPALHGCIRLRPDNAATLFDLVKRNISDTRIVVTGGGEGLMAARRPARPAADVADETGTRFRYGTPRLTRTSDSFEEIFSEPPRYTVRRTNRRTE
jgi:hypothetical protein